MWIGCARAVTYHGNFLLTVPGRVVNPNELCSQNGDLYLMMAASLGVEAVGIRLLEVGAGMTKRGVFRGTSLHWDDNMTLLGLVTKLLDGGANETMGS